MASTGTAVLDMGNHRDIGHVRNAEARARLMQAAVLDAVERVVAIDISVSTELRVTEERSPGAGVFREQFVNEILQRYHVKWTRSSDFVIRRDPSNGRMWACTVKGRVEQLSVVDEPHMPVEPVPQEPYVLAKRGPVVYLSPRNEVVLETGERYAVIKRPSSGSRFPREKVKGHIVVMDVDGDTPALGRIVDGRYGIHERCTLRPASFPLLRGGLRIGYFERDAWRTMEQDTVSRPVTGMSFDFFEQSLLDGFGISVGVDIFSDQLSDSIPVQNLALRLGGTARIPIIPEVLYLRPMASVGYAQLNQAYGMEGQFMLQGQMDLCLSLSLLDLSGGVRYTHLLVDPGFNGAYAIASLGLDLYRFIPSTHERTKPGFRALYKRLVGG